MVYVKYFDDLVYYFDFDILKLCINNLGFVCVLEIWIDILKYGLLGMVNFVGYDVCNSFVFG